VHPALQHAASSIWTELQRERLTPSSFWARLKEIPAAERDRWLDVLWDVGEIPADAVALPRGCVPYLPCPLSLVLEAVQRASVTPDDVFVDVGSGTGRTTFLAQLLTGADCIGLEIQPALVEAARARSKQLNLTRMHFVEGDAVEHIRSVTMGTVFFLYCPFDLQRMNRVLDDLGAIARTRQIRICCVHMPRIERPWLVRLPSTCVELDIYRSSLPQEPAARVSSSDSTPS
jgi:SAM-dependent methyltransferase